MPRLVLLSVVAVCALSAQSTVFTESPTHPAIQYKDLPPRNGLAELNRKIRSGEVQLKAQGRSGYLRSVLQELHVPVESQMVVFSKTSLQADIIGPKNPRTIYFNDSIMVAWVPGEPFVEIITHDPKQGAIFYTLNQPPWEKPQFVRRDECLTCHISNSCLGVPGMLLHSVFPDRDGTPVRTLGETDTDHRTPLDRRWGGWYVTGNLGAQRHLGNRIFTDPHDERPQQAISPHWDPAVYLSPASDVAALMVFEHQVHMMNLLTRYGWQIRVAAHDGQTMDLEAGAREIADYLLFIDEAPVRAPITGTSGFAGTFSAMGPRDPQGRSLRDLDLHHRLMRYPCSYMIYADAFDELPQEGRDAIYRRMWAVLSGQEKDRKYGRLSAADRRNIVEILRATKAGLPGYFRL